MVIIILMCGISVMAGPIYLLTLHATIHIGNSHLAVLYMN